MNAEGTFDFVSQGKQHNQGIELGLTGALTDKLDVSSGIIYTKSRLVDIDNDSYKGHQTQNVPKVRATAQLSYKVPSVEGLRLLSGMQYSSSKYANKEGTAKVGGYASLILVLPIKQILLGMTQLLDSILITYLIRNIGVMWVHSWVMTIYS